MAKITGCTFQDGIVYFADENGEVFPATFSNSPNKSH